MRILVAGGGGFISSHLIKKFLDEGHEVRAVDIKPRTNWEQVDERAENYGGWDLRNLASCRLATRDIDEVYMLAASMGGMGYIETHKLDCMMNVLIGTHMLQASVENGVQRYFYSSSACVYNATKQKDINVTALKEEDAYPADPEDGYGWEKLFSERMCRHYNEETDLTVRVARFHNVYGTHTAWRGGREKAPAAITRKVIEAKLSGRHEIEIWGDGEQTRSFMYVPDCTKGIDLITHSDIDYPINLGSTELVSINELVSIAEGFAGVELWRKYDLTAPQGVRGRNSDNTRIKGFLHWEPSIPLKYGMEELYKWIYKEMTGNVVSV